MAEEEKKNLNKKFFSVGTAADLNNSQKIETLFRAAKNCLSVIPNLQIIIIGDGENKKSLDWLSKKLGIDGLVWFVGKQSYLKKWLENLDICVITANQPQISDFKKILEAQACGIPAIGFHNTGQNNIIEQGKTGILLDKNNSDDLALAIINLFKNKKNRQKLGKAGQEQVVNNFSVEKMVEQFINIMRL